MTIKEYMEIAKEIDSACESVFGKSDGRLYSEIIANCTDIWDNDSCLGYLIRACQDERIDKESTRKLLYAMYHAFNIMSVDQACELYKKKMWDL